MIDQTRFTRMMRRLAAFDRDDFVDVAKSFGLKSDKFPHNDWGLCQIDPFKYYLTCGVDIRSKIFDILIKSEQVQQLEDKDNG